MGGGFLTNRFSSGLWKLALRIHRYKTNHHLLEILGSLLLVAMVLLWFFLTWVAWSLIFCSFDNAIVNASNQQPASNLGRIYLTAYTITTLGRGDYQPEGVVWHLLKGIAAANGFFLVTLSIAYLFPVVSAVTKKRSLALYIASLGGTAEEILARAWNGKDFGQLDQHFIALAAILADVGEKHLTYPVLHYFHSQERSRSFSLSLVALDEALTLLEYAVASPAQIDPASLNPLRRASTAFIKTLKSVYLQPAKHTPKLPCLELIKSQQIPLKSDLANGEARCDRPFEQAMDHLQKRRRLLLALVTNDGWTWDAVDSKQTTNRANHLDDQTPINQSFSPNNYYNYEQSTIEQQYY